MKRKLACIILTVFASMCLCFGLAACGEKSGGNETVGDDPTVEQPGGEPKPEHEHSFINYIYNNDATCTKDGTETGKCSCGATDKRTKSGTALGHTFKDYVSNGDATCLENGTETAKCIRCTAEDTREEQNSALGHAMQPVAAQEPTCTAIGWDAYQQCSRCLKKENYTEKAALGHDYKTETKPATCVEAGYNKVACSRCGDQKSYQELEKLPHFEYSCTTEEAIVTGLRSSCKCSNLEIPDTYNGLPVTTIDKNAFVSNHILKKVTIGNHVTTIEEKAFYDCNKLTDITMSQSVTHIEQYAFGKCGELAEVSFSEQLKVLGKYAFSECYGLTEITIPAGVTSIEMYAFKDCSGLRSVTWNAENCTKAGDYIGAIFKGCTNIKSVKIGENVKIIAEATFCELTGITEITISENVTSIGSYAFRNCGNLTTIIWNAENCTKAGDSYGRRVFDGCTNVKTIQIGENVKIIPNYAFYHCDMVTGIEIPYGVTKIGERAFAMCSNLTGALEIPDSVTEIGKEAFFGCSSLTSVTIGENVSAIGQWAFDSCKKLETVYFADPFDWPYSSSKLSDPQTAAQYLTVTYKSKTWIKN